MAQQFPCPNPACTHVFKAAEVAQSEVRCPRCGFQLKGRAAKPKPPGAAPAKGRPVPVAKPANAAKPTSKRTPMPPAKAPVAQPVPVAKPAPKIAVAQPVLPPAAPPPKEEFDVELVEVPEGEGDDGFDPAPGAGPLIRTQTRRRGLPMTKLLMAIGALFTAACLVVVAYLAIVHLFSGGEGVRMLLPKGGVIGSIKTRHGQEKIFQLAISDKTWVMDKDIKAKIKSQSTEEVWFAEAWKHHQDDVWFALLAKDYGTQKPRDAEMVRVAVDKLEQLFGEAVEADAKAEATKFGALPAQKLRFQGLIRSSKWRGDCYMFFKSGFAYWFLISSPDVQLVAQTAEDLQREDVFSTHLVERRGWREQPPPTESFASSSGAFSLTGVEGIWEKHEAKNEDERGVLMLFGKYRKEKDNRKNATLLVFTMDRQPDLKEAVKAARADVEAKKKEENSNYKLSTAAEVAEGQSEIGESADFGSRSGRMADLCLKINEDPKRYILLGVINEQDACYVFRCECPWDSRQIWRQDFLDLLRSYRAKKAAS